MHYLIIFLVDDILSLRFIARQAGEIISSVYSIIPKGCGDVNTKG